MRVLVKHFATVREIVGKKEESIEVEDGITVENLLKILSERYGQQFADYVFDRETGLPREHLQFLIDGKSATSLEGLKTKIPNGCQFAIIPPVGGGSPQL
jgi:MoaD family protein